MKLKTIFFDGARPYPGSRGPDTYCNVKPEWTIEETGNGLRVRTEKQSFFYPWPSIGHLEEVVEAQVISLELKSGKGA